MKEEKEKQAQDLISSKIKLHARKPIMGSYIHTFEHLPPGTVIVKKKAKKRFGGFKFFTKQDVSETLVLTSKQTLGIYFFSYDPENTQKSSRISLIVKYRNGLHNRVLFFLCRLFLSIPLVAQWLVRRKSKLL